MPFSFESALRQTPKSSANKLSLDKNGYIKINADCQTNLENVYAIGDVANPISPTVSTAVGTGATAVKSIFALFN